MEQLAEEAAELAKAALKETRILRKENPTPVQLDEARMELREEVTDVCLCMDVLEEYSDGALYAIKLDRWDRRLNEEGLYNIS